MSAQPATDLQDFDPRASGARREFGRGDEQQPPREPRRRGDITIRNDAIFGAYAVVVQHKSSKRTGRRQKATLASLRLRGIGSRHVIYVNRAHLGMLRRVEPWTHVFPTSLPRSPAPALIDSLRSDVSMKAAKYKASGGESEHRTYEAGEQALVELHEGSFTVLWSAALPARNFLYHLLPLIAQGSGEARMSTIDHRAVDVPIGDVLRVVDAEPHRFTFIRLDFPGRAVTWEAANVERALDRLPFLPGEVAVISNELEPDWLEGFVAETATPHVAADAGALVESAKRLTGHHGPAQGRR